MGPVTITFLGNKLLCQLACYLDSVKPVASFHCSVTRLTGVGTCWVFIPISWGLLGFSSHAPQQSKKPIPKGGGKEEKEPSVHHEAAWQILTFPLLSSANGNSFSRCLSKCMTIHSTRHLHIWAASAKPAGGSERTPLPCLCCTIPQAAAVPALRAANSISTRTWRLVQARAPPCPQF